MHCYLCCTALYCMLVDGPHDRDMYRIVTKVITFEFDVGLSVHHCIRVEKKTKQMLPNGLLHLKSAQHVSGTYMPIIGSSRDYLCYCRIWRVMP
jgi:hypothetical protein